MAWICPRPVPPTKHFNGHWPQHPQSVCTCYLFPERWAAPRSQPGAGVSACLLLICISSLPPLQTGRCLRAVPGLCTTHTQGRKPQRTSDPGPSSAGEEAAVSLICLMTTATRICNHALTVYKAAFTPINSTDANSTSPSCQPAWQQWELHSSEGETGLREGAKSTCPRTYGKFGVQLELGFSDVVCPCHFQSNLINNIHWALPTCQLLGRQGTQLWICPIRKTLLF